MNVRWLDDPKLLARFAKSKALPDGYGVGLDERVTAKNSINRVDAADCLLAALDDPATVNQSFLVTGR